MRRRSNLLFYLILNIIVSAATTLGILMMWERFNPSPLTLPASGNPIAGEEIVQALATSQPVPTATLPSLDKPVIEIVSVIAAGDLKNEVVMLRRTGDGNLLMTGWSLKGSRGSQYTFPAQPELTLYKDGAMQIYSGIGDGTPLDVFLDRSEPAWHPGETLQLIDREGNQRAEYTIP